MEERKQEIKFTLFQRSNLKKKLILNTSKMFQVDKGFFSRIKMNTKTMPIMFTV